MRVFRVRNKLGVHGLLLLQHGGGFKVTNNGTAKELFEKDFPNLHEVEKWFKETHTNRLTDEEAEVFDEYWKDFVRGQWI
jgi:hypothetical protein